MAIAWSRQRSRSYRDASIPTMFPSLPTRCQVRKEEQTGWKKLREMTVVYVHFSFLFVPPNKPTHSRNNPAETDALYILCTLIQQVTVEWKSKWEEWRQEKWRTICCTEYNLLWRTVNSSFVLRLKFHPVRKLSCTLSSWDGSSRQMQFRKTFLHVFYIPLLSSETNYVPLHSITWSVIASLMKSALNVHTIQL